MPTEARYQEAVPAMEVFATNLKAVLDKTGMTVTELANAANVARPAVSRFLHGKGGNCTMATAEALAKAINVPLWKLMKPPAK